MSPLLTIAICTYNRAELLRECLGALTHQTAPAAAWELLVIDNNSPDETPEVVDAFLAANPATRGRRVLETKQGLSHARNRAYAEAAAPWVLYLDDDAKAREDFAARALYIIQQTDHRIVGGVYYPWYHYGRPAWYRDRYASNALPHRKLTVPGGNYTACGGVMLWERNLLEELGGFDPKIGMIGTKLAYGEETYLQAKAAALGVRPAYDPDLVIYHVVAPFKLNVDYFFRSYFLAGRDAVVGGQVGTGTGSLLLQFLIGLAVMTKDFLRCTPKLLFQSNYYRENWLIDVFRKMAKRVGRIYTAVLLDRPPTPPRSAEK